MVKTMLSVAAVQSEPIWGDIEATTLKTLDLIRNAAGRGVDVLVFPELWLPGYPFWIWELPVVEWGSRWPDYICNSVRVDGTHMTRIRECCAELGIWVNLGFSERKGDSLWMSTCWIDDEGQVIAHRRKILATGPERVVFGSSTGDSIQNVVDTPIGKLGNLMCWEHTQNLLCFHTASQGVQLNASSWPALFPSGEAGQGHWGTTAGGILALSQSFAITAGSFVIVSTCFISPAGAIRLGLPERPANEHAHGASRVIGPDGRIIAGMDLGPYEEGLAIAKIDMLAVTMAKTLLDTVGHYSRPDLLSVRANVDVHYVSTRHKSAQEPAETALSVYPPIARLGSKKIADSSCSGESSGLSVVESS